MSRIEDGLIFQRPPAQCDLCGKVAELRPYGPKGEYICFQCMKRNEPAAKEQFRKRLEAFERKQKEKGRKP